MGIHPFHLDELCLMVSGVCWLNPSHIFEWGTNIGISARIFYETSRYFNLSTEIHSVDLPDEQDHAEHPGKRRGMMVRNIDRVKLHQGDGAITALKIWQSVINPNHPLFFLDGDHSYESVKRELHMIYDHVEYANFLIHDTFFQTPLSGYNTGPFLAVRDFMSKLEGNFERIEANLGLPGMTLLYHREQLEGGS